MTLLRGFGVHGVFALVTHAAILYYARDSPRTMLAAIFFHLMFRILAVKGFLTLYRRRPTELMKPAWVGVSRTFSFSEPSAT